jgi:hypothetical protein
MEIGARPRAGLIDGQDIIDIHACDAFCGRGARPIEVKEIGILRSPVEN